MHTAELAKSRFIVIEDEWMLAQALVEELMDLKCEVVGRAANLAEASSLVIIDDYDAAIVDLNLRGESAIPLIERLWRDGRSVLIVSGLIPRFENDALSVIPSLARPYTFEAFKEAIKQTMRIAGARRLEH
jgi:DNA-binding response OmpR family regulator